MNYVLDTDHFSLIDRGLAEGRNILSRLSRLPEPRITTTVITVEEQMRGWMARVAAARNLEAQMRAYQDLKRFILSYVNVDVLDFDQKAGTEFERLRKSRLRIGTMDLKIAAIALANDATLLTHNISDFGKVPGLRVEDWTI